MLVELRSYSNMYSNISNQPKESCSIINLGLKTQRDSDLFRCHDIYVSLRILQNSSKLEAKPQVINISGTWYA
jgi:hypothetical protein